MNPCLESRNEPFSLLISPQKKKKKDENTENTQMQCGEETQKEAIRIIDIGLPQIIKVFIGSKVCKVIT